MSLPATQEDFSELARLAGFSIKPSVLQELVSLVLEGRSAGQLIILLNSLMVARARA